MTNIARAQCRRERCQNCSSTPRNRQTTNLRMRTAEQDHSIVMQPWCRAYSRTGRIKTAQDTKRSPAGKKKPTLVHSDTSQFFAVCEELEWTHDMSTPYRPKTSGITTGAVRRAKEDASALMVQSGLSEGSWSHVIHPTKEHSKHHLMGQSFLFGAILIAIRPPK